MKLLLDTHALLWALQRDPRLSTRAAEAIDGDNNEIIVSAVSVLEVAIKHRLGKLPEAALIVANWSETLGNLAATPLPIGMSHAARAGAFPFAHRDPFDRLLIAQAEIEGLTLVSNEQLFDKYGVRRLW